MAAYAAECPTRMRAAYRLPYPLGRPLHTSGARRQDRWLTSRAERFAPNPWPGAACDLSPHPVARSSRAALYQQNYGLTTVSGGVKKCAVSDEW
jgi:hypothetical protein